MKNNLTHCIFWIWRICPSWRSLFSFFSRLIAFGVFLERMNSQWKRLEIKEFKHMHDRYKRAIYAYTYTLLSSSLLLLSFWNLKKTPCHKQKPCRKENELFNKLLRQSKPIKTRNHKFILPSKWTHVFFAYISPVFNR